ncbi:CHAT domain-containing protein [Nocardia thailandica]
MLKGLAIEAQESRSPAQVRAAVDELVAFLGEFVPTMGSSTERVRLGMDVMRAAVYLESHLSDCNWFRVATIAQLHAGCFALVAAKAWDRNDAELAFRRTHQPVFVLGTYASHRCGMPAFARMLLEHVSGGLYEATQSLTAIRAAEPNPRKHAGLALQNQRWVQRFRGADFWHEGDRDTRIINRRLEEFRQHQFALARQAPVHRLVVEADLRHCVTELAAWRSGRDVVYVLATPFGGVAVRVFGDRSRLGASISIDLPLFTEESVERWQAGIEAMYESWENGEFDAAELRARLDGTLAELGEAWSQPVRTAWPDLKAFALVPVAEAASLPLAAATVDERPAQLAFDMTVVPDAGNLLAASLHEVSTGGEVVVAVDASTGDAAIPKVVAEGEAVAAIHRTALLNLGRDPEPGPSDDEDDRIRTLGAARSVELAGIYALQPLAPLPDDGILDAIGRASLVHIACHGALVDDPVYNSVLLLGPEPVSLSEFLLRPVAPGGVVVLSCCSVGGVVRSIPNELLGFPAAFLSAGARTVIASTVPVFDSRATIRLLTDLHHVLRSGADGRTALRAAVEASWQRGDPSMIWGGFTAFGA